MPAAATMTETMQIETASIDDVHLDPANTRTHPERNKAAIRASLTRFRAGRSIVLDANNVVRAGNGTIEEARQAGFDEVLIVEPKPNQIVAVKRADWSASEATAYSVADNRIASLAEDDDAALATTLRALQSEDFDLAAVGYSDEELQGLIDGLADRALDSEADGKEYDESVADEVKYCECPSCGHKWPA
jgi:hypothetical protein